MDEEKEKLLKELTEEHESDIKSDQTSADDENNDDGGDRDQDQSEDASAGDSDSDQDDADESSDSEESQDEDKSGEDEDESAESDDSGDSKTEPVGKKKDANSRIRQLLDEKKAIEEKLAEKIEAERKRAELEEDPVYKLEDFIGTLDEDGEVLTDKEATARFKAWEADHKLRGYERKQVLQEQQDTLIKLQSETREAFTKFPEFDMQSEDYDEELASIADEAFRVGLQYAAGHDGDDNYIIGSRVNPGKLLEKLHNLRVQQTPAVTKVNNLGDEGGKIVNSRQAKKKEPKYAPGFQGEVDKELDKLISSRK